MTTPDKEEVPTKHIELPIEIRIPLHSLQADIGYLFGRVAADGSCASAMERSVRDRLKEIERACNAYEPMREALILAEKADRIHSKCQECEDGAQAPEACGDCFPSADDARVARRNVLKSLGVRMRDVDRARAIKAEPSICNCSQEDVHDYGPCGEDCRSLVVSTLPVNDRHHSGSDNERLQSVADQALSKDSVRAFIRENYASVKGTDRQTSDDVGRLRALLVALDALIEQCRPLIAVDAFVLRDAIYEAHQARAALKGSA